MEKLFRCHFFLKPLQLFDFVGVGPKTVGASSNMMGTMPFHKGWKSNNKFSASNLATATATAEGEEMEWK